MKKTLTVLALSVLIWGCAKKTTPTASTGVPASNSGSVANAPAAKAGTVTTNAGAVAAAAVTPVTPTTPEGTRSPVEAAKSPEMLGQAIHNAKCGRCHGLKVVSDYTADRWVSIMQVMAPKAHLDDTEKANVLAYVKANAKK